MILFSIDYFGRPLKAYSDPVIYKHLLHILMGTCGFCQPDQGLSYGQYPIPISPSVPGQASFVVPPPLDRTTQQSNPAFIGTPQGGFQTSQFGGQVGAGPNYGPPPGLLGPGVGTTSSFYGQGNPLTSSIQGQRPPFGQPPYGQPMNSSFGRPGGPLPGAPYGAQPNPAFGRR